MTPSRASKIVSLLLLLAAPASAQEVEPSRVLEESLALIEREYFDAGVTREELVEAALRGIVEHLNRRAARAGHPPINALLSRREVARLQQAIAGEVTGIGVLARPGPDGIEVLQVFAGSPAGRAGLRPGDRIAAIDDRQTAQGGMDVFGLLRGDVGSKVSLSVVREAGSEHPTNFAVKLVRGRYHVNSVVARMLDNDVGYLRVGGFSRGTYDEVADSLLAFREQGAWGVVLDLRGSPGGALESATAIAGLFVTPGRPLLQIQRREEDPHVLSAEGEVLWTGPLAVLVDGGTAASAEALASALKENERALLVGDRTAGRGLAESVFALPTGGALRLATARYASITGRSWVHGGLEPDSPIVHAPLDPLDPIDPQLRAALTIMARFRPRSAGSSP